MPLGASPTEIVAGKFVRSDADPLSQIFGSIVRDQCAIVSEKTACVEKTQLRGQAEPRSGRFGIDEINVGEAQAPIVRQNPNSKYSYPLQRSSNLSAMSRTGASRVNPASCVPTTLFELARIAYVERPAWQDLSSCISQIRTVRSYVRPIFWPFSHGHDEVRGANRLISFSRCNALAILRSDLLRDVVPLGHHNWHLASLSPTGWPESSYV